MKMQIKRISLNLIFIIILSSLIILILNINSFIPDYKNVAVEHTNDNASMKTSNYITRKSDYSKHITIDDSLHESYYDILKKEVFIKIKSYIKAYYDIELLNKDLYYYETYRTDLGVTNYLLYYTDKEGVTVIFTDDGKNIQIDCGNRFYKGSSKDIEGYEKNKIINDIENVVRSINIDVLNNFKTGTFSNISDSSMYALEDVSKNTVIYYDGIKNKICGIIYGFK